MKISDGRLSFYQWDCNQKLLVEDDRIEQLHFPTTEGNALVCPVYEEQGTRMADVPNILLQADGWLKVFAVAGGRTLYACRFQVNPKEKPDDYIYTETEVWTAEKAVEQALEQARESGGFDGPPGPKGDPGVVKFTVVNELPEEDTENAIYLVPVAEGATDNLFDEYIYVDGAWEKIGSTSVAVDLTDYVKNTDYATQHKAGVVKVKSDFGLVSTGDGYIYPCPAYDTDVNSKAPYTYSPLMPRHIDKIVKVGITTNTVALTDEEKAAAQEWLGMTDKIGMIDSALDELHAYAQVLISGGGS